MKLRLLLFLVAVHISASGFARDLEVWYVANVRQIVSSEIFAIWGTSFYLASLSRPIFRKQDHELPFSFSFLVHGSASGPFNGGRGSIYSPRLPKKRHVGHS